MTSTARAWLDRRHRVLDAEGGRRARHVHVVAVARDTERALHLDGDGRVGALHVAARDHDHVDVGRRAPGPLVRLAGGGHGHLGLQRDLLVAALGDARDHARRVEDAVLLHHIARLDAGDFFDELGARRLQRGALPRGDRVGVLGVEAGGVRVEAVDELFVRNRKRRRVQAGSADDDWLHGLPFKGGRIG
jgi:hypothetical protein